MWLSHAAMSTLLAFSRTQKARHISVPTFSLSNEARPRLGGMASANVGESKVTREKKRRGKVGKDELAAAALDSARLMGDALLASSATQSLVFPVKEREALSNEITRKKRASSKASKEQKVREHSHRRRCRRAEKQRDADNGNVPSGRSGKEMQIRR